MMRVDSLDSALRLEVTEGCRYSCTGCNVDKDAGYMPDQNELKRLIELADNLKENGVRLSDIVIGPTDVMGAANYKEIFENPTLKELVSRYSSLLVACSLLNPDRQAYVRFGADLRRLAGEASVNIEMPYEIAQIDNIAYNERLRERVRLIQQGLGDKELCTLFVVVNYDSTISYDRKNNTKITERLMLRLDRIEIQEPRSAPHDYNHLDIVLSQGRKSLRDPDNAHRLLSSLRDLNERYVRIYNDPDFENESIGVNNVLASEGKIWDITYLRGELFLIPFIVDAFVTFEPEYRYDGNWDFESIYQHSEQAFLEQIAATEDLPECADCRFSIHCAGRGVIKMMGILDTKECISNNKPLSRFFIED